MPIRAKIILAVLAVITLAGVGYFFIINKPKPEILPPVNTSPKTEEIVTSDWQTYRNEKLGFEIKMPRGWSGGYYLGRMVPDDPEFWQDQVGGASFNGQFSVSSSPQFNLRVKDSNLTLDEFLGDSWGQYTVNGLPAKIKILDYRNDSPKRRSYTEFVLIKNNKRYFNFEFSASIANIDQDVLIWKEILKTFKPISQ